MVEDGVWGTTKEANGLMRIFFVWHFWSLGEHKTFMFAFVWLRIIGSRMSSMEVVYSFFDDLEVLVTLSILNTWIRKRNCDEHLDSVK